MEKSSWLQCQFRTSSEDRNRNKKWKRQFHHVSCVFFLKTPFLSGDVVKAEFLINCVRASIIDALSVVVVLLLRPFGGQHVSSQEQEWAFTLFSAAQFTIFSSVVPCVWGFLFFSVWNIIGVLELLRILQSGFDPYRWPLCLHASLTKFTV